MGDSASIWVHMNSMTIKDKYTVKQAAEQLGVHAITVHRWIKLGRLKPVRLGPRKIHFPKDYIDRILQEGITD